MKIGLYILTTIILLVILLLLSLQLRPVQQYVAHKATAFLSKELGTEISIEGIYIKPFSSISVEGLFVADRDRDTLLYAGQLKADVNLSQLLNSKLTIKKVELIRGDIFLKRFSDGTTNLAFIIDYFSGTERKEPKKKKLDLNIYKAHFVNTIFKYRNFADSSNYSGSINWGDIAVSNLNGDLEDIDVVNHIFRANVIGLSLNEKSGLSIKTLKSLVTIDTNRMVFEKLFLQTNRSQVGDYLLFDFDSFKDFSDFNHKVNMKGHVVNSRINSRDIEFFAPDIKATKFDLKIDGDVWGTVNELNGSGLSIKGAKATYIKADAHIKGLPEIERTIFDLKIKQMSSNLGDLNDLIPAFSGNAKAVLPAVFGKLGHINFSGVFKGYYSHFNVNGKFKTALGSVQSNMDLDMRSVNSYNGTIKVENLHLGKITDNDKLGLSSFSGKVQGKGFDVNELSASTDLAIGFIEFNNYRYHGINLKGSFVNRIFEGETKIDDENLNLTASGKVDLSSKEAKYSFNSKIDHASLMPLHFYNDTLRVEGEVNSDFQGNDINAMQGYFKLSGVVIRMPGHSASIDSISVTASGEGHERTLSLSSDLADARMHGEIDLNTFPSYFKSIARRYVPSWDAKLLIPGRQQFDFVFRLKKAEPIFMLFAPQVQIPDYMILNGQFSNVDSVAIMNGFIPSVLIGKSKLTNVILDGGALENALNFTVTADRLDITDSLYIKNINISSLLARDSLNFNVKLSDVNATNQLDLNGLVAFKENESAHVSLLPSNIIINREDWVLEDRVNFDFQQGRTIIEHFELANGKQKVTLNGAVSKNAEDRLHILFSDFELRTFDGLTRAFGINLQGTLNGDFEFASVLSKPYLAGNVKAYDMIYNETQIGELTASASMDPETNIVNLDMSIDRQDLQTLKLTGTYDVMSESDNLNLSARFQESEIVIFEPFLNGLVSDLEGKISADMQISGSLSQLDINGTVRLHKVFMTVDYLNTRYQLDDKFEVDNSKITLANLKLLDKNSHIAIANGTVDMRTVSDPDIDIKIEADNFMVLNTTAKDNELYYGQAFASGQFGFVGPTSKMNIDIKARSEAGTVFNIPLNATGTVSDNEFIRFVSAADSAQLIAPKSYLDGLTMHIDLAINRNSQVNLFTNMGKLSGVGDGTIAMNITSLGDFEMFGDYVILQGKFDFTAQDFINKIFEINSGGTIRWTGNPSEAQINLTAIYEVRTSVRPLYTAAGRAGTDARVLAQAQMNLSGSLLHPEIGFNIAFPIDSYVKDELQSYFSDANNINQQALSLIVRRSFAPGTGSDFTTEINNTVLSAGTELAFNQLNNIISQSLNLNFVDFNIRSLNEASASIRLWNNRLILTGGVTDRRSSVNDLNVFGNQVATDAELIYLIRRNGNLMFRASNRLNNRNFLNPNDEYISALGLVYRQEFDNFGEFARRMLRLDRTKSDTDGLEAPLNTSPTSPTQITNPTVAPSSVKGTKRN